MNNKFISAPELEVTDWFNTNEGLKLSKLRGKVVVLHAFQMLCPGCVSHGLPQASAIYELYKQQAVQVIGLHTVFEHHDVMNKQALEAFVHEYRLPFPIAIDRANEKHAIPKTMEAYQLRGTPSLVLIDQQGYVRLNHFGRLSDLQVGDAIGQLLTESKLNSQKINTSLSQEGNKNCDSEACAIS